VGLLKTSFPFAEHKAAKPQKKKNGKMAAGRLSPPFGMPEAKNKTDGGQVSE